MLAGNVTITLNTSVLFLLTELSNVESSEWGTFRNTDIPTKKYRLWNAGRW